MCKWNLLSTNCRLGHIWPKTIKFAILWAIFYENQKFAKVYIKFKITFIKKINQLRVITQLIKSTHIADWDIYVTCCRAKSKRVGSEIFFALFFGPNNGHKYVILWNSIEQIVIVLKGLTKFLSIFCLIKFHCKVREAWFLYQKIDSDEYNTEKPHSNQ